jgi:hypothetical protein
MASISMQLLQELAANRVHVIVEDISGGTPRYSFMSVENTYELTQDQLHELIEKRLLPGWMLERFANS